MRLFIGYDSRQPAAFAVARNSAERFGCDVVALREDRLRMQGILTRPVDTRDSMFDLNSSAPQSTEFAISRFSVGILAHSGWAMFADSDTVFMTHPIDVMRYADPRKAVMVVKHKPIDVTAGTMKMDGQQQQPYRRKLWSSVFLFNCDHPANRRLNLMTLNQWPGRDLHAFSWLDDGDIGALDASWNHLIGIDPPRNDAKILHYTLGTPDMDGHGDCEHAAVWWRHHAQTTYTQHDGSRL